MQLAHAAQDDLVQRRDVLDLDGRVFRLRVVQRVGGLLGLGVVGRLDGQPEHRARQPHGLQMKMIFVV